MCPLCCGSCRGLSFQSYLPVLTCTWAAEQDPLCVFLCGSLPGVCLTWERVVIPQQGWPLSFYLCALRNFTFLFQRRKLLQNLTFHANRYHIGEADRKKCVDKYQPWAVDGVGGGYLLAWFESGSFHCGGCIFSLDFCGPSPAALIPPAVQKHGNHGDKLSLMDRCLVF